MILTLYFHISHFLLDIGQLQFVLLCEMVHISFCLFLKLFSELSFSIEMLIFYFIDFLLVLSLFFDILCPVLKHFFLKLTYFNVFFVDLNVQFGNCRVHLIHNRLIFLKFFCQFLIDSQRRLQLPPNVFNFDNVMLFFFL